MIDEKQVAVAGTAAAGVPDGWRVVRFGDVVRNVDVSERQPLEQGLERYVGLDHLDPESLHIKRWGLIEEGTSFTRKFVRGQVLFGKRRAYQRKAAVAEFDGICSGDILVFEPKGDELLPELLPFIVQSDGFFEHALGTSAGSLSPRTKWSDLARYEFALPPKDEQRRICNILWAADDSLSLVQVSMNSALDFKNRISELLLNKGIGHKKFKKTVLGDLPEEWEVKPLRDVTDSSAYGPRFSAELYVQEYEGNVQTIRTTDFDRKGGLETSSAPFTKLPDDVIDSHKLQEGDFLVSRSGAYAGLTAVFTQVRGTFIPAAFVIRFRLNKQVSPHFLKYLFYSEFLNKFVLPLSRGSAQPNISGSALLSLNIPVPSMDEQLRIVSMLNQISNSLAFQENHFVNTLKMSKCLTEKLLFPTF